MGKKLELEKIDLERQARDETGKFSGGKKSEVTDSEMPVPQNEVTDKPVAEEVKVDNGIVAPTTDNETTAPQKDVMGKKYELEKKAHGGQIPGSKKTESIAGTIDQNDQSFPIANKPESTTVKPPQNEVVPPTEIQPSKEPHKELNFVSHC